MSVGYFSSMRQKLKNHALKAYDYFISYYDVILDGFPEEKLEEKVGEAETPLHLLKHVGGTPGWWMKQRGTRLPFSSSLNSLSAFKEVIRKQRDAFKELLEDDGQLYWLHDGEEKPKLSIPWLMIRSVHHAIHHGGMLIMYRHIYGLPPLKYEDQFDWGKMVDLPGEIHYSTLTS